MIIVFQIATGLIGAFIVASCIWAIVKHPEWPIYLRSTIGLIAAGITWGGMDRALGLPIGMGDVLLMIGVSMLVHYLVFAPDVIVKKYIRSQPIKLWSHR